MKRFILAAAPLLLAVAPTAHAQFNQSALSSATGGGGGGGHLSCTEGTAFIARLSSPDANHQNGYNDLICTLVSDGTWAKMDAFYVLGAADTTSANLNLVSTSYGLTPTSTAPTFAADHGYTGVDASDTIFLHTGFVPSVAAGVYVQDSAHMAFWSLTNVSSDVAIPMQAYDSAHDTFVYSRQTNGNTYYDVNAADHYPSAAIADSLGLYVATRTASNLTTLYKNGVSIGTDTTASNGLPANEFEITGGSQSNGSALQLSMASFGSGLTATDDTNIKTAVCLYSADIGVTWAGC